MEAEMRELRRQVAAEREHDGHSSHGPSNGLSNSLASGLASGFASEPAAAEPSLVERTVVSDGLPAATWTAVKRESTPLFNAGPELAIDWNCSSKTQGDVTLDEPTIEGLFREYVNYYHPILPVVDVSKGPEGIYRVSLPLFWSIMAIASRRYQDGVLLTKLSTVQKACLADIAVSPVTRYTPSHMSSFNLPSVYAVQSFLLCTLWPLPTSSINADSSWNTSGIAYFTAMRAGLHYPGYEKDFGRIYRNSDPSADMATSAKKSEQCMTWLATTTVSQMIAGMFGYPSIAMFPKPALYKGMEMPLSIRHQYAIYSVAHEIETSVNSNARELLALAPVGERLSMLRILSARLDEVELEYGSQLNDAAWFSLLSTRVALNAYYFFDNDGISAFELQKGYVAAYNASLALMDHVRQAQARSSLFMLYLPLVKVQLLWQASAIVARLYHSKWSRNLDKRKGKELYQATTDNVARASVLEHDVPFRAAEIMPQLWQVYSVMAANGNTRVRDAAVSIRTRHAASVFFDCLWTMRSECEILSHAPTELNVRARRASRNRRPTNLSVGAPMPDQQHNVPMPMPMPPQPPLQALYPVPTLVGPAGAPLPQPPPTPQLPTAQPKKEVTTSPESLNTPILDWDATAAWKDVDLVMGDFGFQMDEFMNIPEMPGLPPNGF